VTAYIVRRLLYAIPILIGVNLITFVLFFVVNSPDDMARMQLGDEARDGRGDPVLEARTAATTGRCFLQPPRQLGHATSSPIRSSFEKSVRSSSPSTSAPPTAGRDIGYDIRQRMWPSLAIAAPGARGGAR
jgi:peptide/nickel transport system permease protein